MILIQWKNRSTDPVIVRKKTKKKNGKENVEKGGGLTTHVSSLNFTFGQDGVDGFSDSVSLTFQTARFETDECPTQISAFRIPERINRNSERETELPTPSNSTHPRCLNIIVALKIIAAGLAASVPMISFPICLHPGSNRAYSRPMLQPGTIPGPPTSAAPMLETMLPYKLGMTMTSNC